MKTENELKPLVYIRAVAGNFDVLHRLTHAYLGTYDNEKDLKARVRELVTMKPEDFWRMLIIKNRVRVPGGKFTEKDLFMKEEEEWYKGAWRGYTEKFYKKNPALLFEEDEFPLDIIKKIRVEEAQKDRLSWEKIEADRKAREARIQEDLKKDRQYSKKDEIKPVPVGKLGSVRGLEKAKAKVKIKKTVVPAGKMVVEFLDSDDLFA